MRVWPDTVYFTVLELSQVVLRLVMELFVCRLTPCNLQYLSPPRWFWGRRKNSLARPGALYFAVPEQLVMVYSVCRTLGYKMR